MRSTPGAGLGLLEVLVALVVLALGVIAFTAVQAAVLRAEARARALSVAADHVRSELALQRGATAASGACFHAPPPEVEGCRFSRLPCADRACLEVGGLVELTVVAATRQGDRLEVRTLRPPPSPGAGR